MTIAAFHSAVRGYATRGRAKSGAGVINKTRHYLDLLIERETRAKL